MCALCRSLLAYNSYIPTYTMALLIHHPIIRHPHEKNSITVHIINFYSLGISTIIYPDSLMGAFVQHGSINFSIARYIYIYRKRIRALRTMHRVILIDVDFSWVIDRISIPLHDSIGFPYMDRSCLYSF